MAMMHNDLISYYERIFAFRQYHQWTMFEIEELIPWELDVMASLLKNYIEKMEMERKQAQLNREAL